jgi:sortase A
MTYQYLKAPPASESTVKRQLFWERIFQKIKKLSPTLMIALGASLLISIGYPIISYELTVAQRAKRPTVISPLIDENLSAIRSGIGENNLQPQVLAGNSAPNNTVVDYTKINSWFNFSHPQNFLNPSAITNYTISIPKLRISEAVVTIGGDDLSHSLIHYGGTANPGEPGNGVIFGHSTLPQFYNPKSYNSIFSLLPTLRNGDEIMVSFDGITYKYQVYDYYEVSPDQIDILEQQYNKKDLTLVTCTPPGTYWRRGIVKAKLVSL